MGYEYAISMQKKYSKTRKSPRLEKLWPQDKKMEEKTYNPPQNVRKEETEANHNNGQSPHNNITDTNREEKIPHGDEKEEKINNNKKVTFKKDVKYKTRSVTTSQKRRKTTVKRKSPRLAKIQRRTNMTSTTTDEYEHNKHKIYYIRRQTKSKNDVKAESQPIPDIIV